MISQNWSPDYKSDQPLPSASAQGSQMTEGAQNQS